MRLVISSITKRALSWAVLVLVASLLLGACTATSTGKNDDPRFFGAAGGENGAGGATGGMSFSW
jgi:hypothetical protein